MQYGDKKVRYAVIEKDGHLREVVGAQYNSKSETYTDTQPKALVKIKNNGTTANDITLTDTGTNGSYIIKNDSKYVSNFGWIDTNAVSIPSGETIATNGQSSAGDKNIVTGNDGQFEITDWSNCKGEELGTAFRGAKCIKIIPSDWPNTNITSLYRTLAGITIDKIPNWTNTNSVLDARELFNGTTINDDLKIDGMITNLSVVTQVKKFLNNCIINKYSYTEGDFKFYNLYKSLLPKIKAITNAAACFGGTQYDKETQTYTDSYNYAVKFKYTDSTGQTANVIPPDLMYIPKEWGGFEHNTFAYVSMDDSTFSNLGLTITDAHLDWNLGSYKTLKYSDSKWIISGNRDFYNSISIVVECINENTSETTFVIIDKYGSKEITWPDTLDVDDTYTIKIHVYLENPDSKSKPSISGGKIVTDWHEYYLKSDEEYRGTDGVYTRTGQVPFDATAYDITKCTITGKPLSQGATEIPWEVYDEDGNRVDNGTNPPDNYVVSLSDGTNTYTFGEGTVLVTSAVIPIYSIPEGMCTDSDGNVITDIPDGDYYIDITAYKNGESCNVVSQVTVENWTQYDDTCSVVFDTDTENLTWTVRVMKGETDVTESMIENKSMTVWIYDADNTLIVPGFYLPSNTYKLDDKNVIKIQNVTENPGTYRLEVAQVKSKRGWYIPPTGSVAATETLTIPDSGAVDATLTSVDFNGIIFDNTDAANFEFYLDNELNESQLHVGYMSLNTKPEGSVSSWTYTLVGLGVPSGIISKTQEVIKLLIDDVVVEKTLWKYTINKTYNSTKYNAFGIGFDAWVIQKVSMLISNTASNDICFGITTNSYFQASCLNSGSTSIDGWLNFTSVGSPYRV